MLNQRAITFDIDKDHGTQQYLLSIYIGNTGCNADFDRFTLDVKKSLLIITIVITVSLQHRIRPS